MDDLKKMFADVASIDKKSTELIGYIDQLDPDHMHLLAKYLSTLKPFRSLSSS